MALFDFLKKTAEKTSDILIPNTCPTGIPFEIADKVEKINWAEFKTAYGNAEMTIPFYLKNLFCADTKIAMDATHQLWCSLCHQHAFISTAALPSYDILKIGLLILDDKLKIELLDIFQGFAYCSSTAYAGIQREGWKLQLRQKLLEDIILFRDLTRHPDKEISAFANNIVDSLVIDK